MLGGVWVNIIEHLKNNWCDWSEVLKNEGWILAQTLDTYIGGRLGGSRNSRTTYNKIPRMPTSLPLSVGAQGGVGLL